MKPAAARRITIAAHASCTLGVNASRLAADGASGRSASSRGNRSEDTSATPNSAAL